MLVHAGFGRDHVPPFVEHAAIINGIRSEVGQTVEYLGSFSQRCVDKREVLLGVSVVAESLIHADARGRFNDYKGNEVEVPNLPMDLAGSLFRFGLAQKNYRDMIPPLLI